MLSQEAAKMKTRIAEELESEELYRFHDDFRRALLMHRKACLTLPPYGRIWLKGKP
jgi:hypothetical protein